MPNASATSSVIPSEVPEARNPFSSPSVVYEANPSSPPSDPPHLPPLSTCALNTLSSRAKRGICFSSFLRSTLAITIPFFVLAISALPVAAQQPQRPRISGIAGVTVYSSDLASSKSFYDFFQPFPESSRDCVWCETPNFSVLIPAIYLPSGQTLTFDKMPKKRPASLLEEITFRTDNLYNLLQLLKANRIHCQQVKDSGKLIKILLKDPEGNRIAFKSPWETLQQYVQEKSKTQNSGRNPIDFQIIHAGIIVHDRAAEDHFYKDILGFHVYWHGGMVDRSAVAHKEDDQTDWVDMQVPDGTDWIEYMLNVSANADKHTLGIMNHIALGVPDIHVAEEQLLKNGMKLTEKPQIGRDGKWQLNLYDPDGTRVELMEFTPVQKPCCAPFTGPHPGPNK